MASTIKISQLTSGIPTSNGIFPYVESGQTLKTTFSGAATAILSNLSGLTATTISASTFQGQLIVNTTTQSTTNYTLQSSDGGTLVQMNSSSPNTLLIPPFGTTPFSNGVQISVAQYGTGQTTISGGTGVTIRSYGNATKLAGQYAGATLHKIGTNEWFLFGNLSF
jgi:hypothetical protein